MFPLHRPGAEGGLTDLKSPSWGTVPSWVPGGGRRVDVPGCEKGGARAQSREWVKTVRRQSGSRCSHTGLSAKRVPQLESHEWDVLRAFVQEQQRKSDGGKMDMVAVSK